MLDSVSRPGRRNTRDALLDAAARLFVERGYHGVGLETVAEEVGVTRQTVYNQFGSKPGLLRATSAFIEDRAGLPAHLSRVFAQTDGLSMLHAMLDALVAVEPLVRPISRIVHAARIEDETARELWHNRMNSRLMGMTMVMNRIGADGRLKDGLSPEEAAEVAWSIASPHHYEFLVIDRGWTPERYRAHLEEAITATVLGAR
jgi:AcrR family transcriptional regulator